MSMNPFAAELAGALSLVYIAPSKGFKARLVVLAALGAVTFIGTITHGVCRHLIAARKGEGRSSFWLVRRVKRPSGGFLVLNASLLREICGIVLSVLTAVIVSVAWRVFFHGAPSGPIYNWTEATYWPVAFVLSWCTSMANLQVYLLLRDDRAALLSARTTNTLLFGWLAIGTAGCLGIFGHELVSAHRISKTAAATFGYLAQQEASWRPGDDVSQELATVQALKQQFSDTLSAYLKVASKAWGVYIIAQASSILVTLATYPLVWSLKAQIQSSLDELQQQASHIAQQSARPFTLAPPMELTHQISKVPSNSQVREMAERQSMSLEGAKRLRTMARIVSELQIQLGAFLAIGVTLLAGCIYFVVVYPTVNHAGWAASEMILFWPLFALLVPHAVAFVFLAANSIHELRAQKAISQASAGAVIAQRRRVSTVTALKAGGLEEVVTRWGPPRVDVECGATEASDEDEKQLARGV